MEEQVIQETPVATPDQPVAGADTAPQIDQSAQLRAEYEGQIAAFRAQAAEAEEKFQGIKSKLDEVYKKQEAQRKKQRRKKPPRKQWAEGVLSFSRRSSRAKIKSYSCPD